MRPSQSPGGWGKGLVASRRRSRKISASSRRVRNAGQQAKRNSRGAAAGDNRQRAIIILHGVVPHLVRGCEQRHEIGCHGKKRRCLPSGHQSTDGNQVKTNGETEALEGLKPRQHRKCASREARDLKSPMTTHQISLSISLMSRSIARFAALG